MDNRTQTNALKHYKAWLIHNEYSLATIEKYTHALARFFADTGSRKKPSRETVAAWRDSLTAKGYTPATVNSLLAAVNMYQESIDNPGIRAKPLKRQRRVYSDPGCELSRAEFSAFWSILNSLQSLAVETEMPPPHTWSATGAYFDIF